jgi:hypothetical protein
MNSEICFGSGTLGEALSSRMQSSLTDKRRILIGQFY